MPGWGTRSKEIGKKAGAGNGVSLSCVSCFCELSITTSFSNMLPLLRWGSIEVAGLAELDVQEF